jgi:hypothetical protein
MHKSGIIGSLSQTERSEVTEKPVSASFSFTEKVKLAENKVFIGCVSIPRRSLRREGTK